MSLKTIILAAGAMLMLAAPAAALADPYWAPDRGYHEGWRDHDGWRGDRDWGRPEWRGTEWREHPGWARPAGYAYDGPRCTIEHRGYYTGYGDWVSRPVRVCYR